MRRRKSEVLEKHDKIVAGDLIKITGPCNLYYNKKDAVNYGFGLHYNVPKGVGSYSSNDENLYMIIEKTKPKNFIGVDYFLINVIDSSGEKWIKIYDSIDFNVVSNFDITTKGKK
jgi:hypothetical protein